MAWPPSALPINRTNATPQLDTHAADHNAVNQAVNDIVAHLGSFLIQARTGAVVTDSGGNVGVTFNDGAFPSPPVVVASGADANAAVQISCYNITAAGFSMHVSTPAGAEFVGSVLISYVAVYSGVVTAGTQPASDAEDDES